MRRWRQVVRHGAAAVLVATAVPAYAGSGPAPAPAPLPDVTAAVGAGAWFEPNVGQDSPEVRYRARGRDAPELSALEQGA